MDRTEMKGAIEAILFTMGDAVETRQIAQALETDRQTVVEILLEMAAGYEAEDRGIRLIRVDDKFQLCTKKEHYGTLIRIATQPRRIHLTDVLMETLAIVAYKQPVTRIEIEKIRGVKSDHAVNKLIEYNLIQEVGRMDAPGRPILLGTTDDFLRHFGIGSAEELPAMDEGMREGFKEQAEKEIDSKLGI